MMMSVEAIRAGTRTAALTPSLIAAVMLGVVLGVPIVYLRDAAPFEALVVVVAVGVVAGVAVFDLKTRLAPNIVTYPAIAVFTISALLISVRSGLDAMAGGAVMFGVFFIMALAGRGKMGFGDVKMAAVSGAIVGLRGVLPLLLVTFLVGGLIAAFMVVGLRRPRQDTVAFTPFLAAGVVVSLAAFDVYLVA